MIVISKPFGGPAASLGLALAFSIFFCSFFGSIGSLLLQFSESHLMKHVCGYVWVSFPLVLSQRVSTGSLGVVQPRDNALTFSLNKSL